MTNTAGEWGLEALTKVAGDLSDRIDSSDFDFPPLDLDLNLDYPDIPECRLNFQFDGLELYPLLNTSISGEATYEIPLYRSNTLVGLSLGRDNLVGVIFSVHLILAISAGINFTSGIHIKIDDGTAIDIALTS